MAYSQSPGAQAHEPTADHDETVVHGGRGTDHTSNGQNGISSFREEDTDASSSDSSSASGDHVADKNKLEKTPSRKEKVQMHFKRFWLFYLIAAIIFLAILLPIL